MDRSILQSYYGLGLTFKLKPELQSHGRISGVSLPLHYLIQLGKTLGITLAVPEGECPSSNHVKVTDKVPWECSTG